MNKVPNGLGVAILMSAILADIEKKTGAPKATDADAADQSIRDFIEKINGAPCDCPICTVRRASQGANKAEAPGNSQNPEVQSTVSSDRETATVRSLTEIEGDVAAMVGLTPDMLEDAASAPATILRITTAQFITTLREAGGGLGEERRVMCAAAETQALNSMELALMALAK